MKFLSRLDSVAGSMNRCLIIVAVMLGVIDFTIYVTQAAADEWRDSPAEIPPPAQFLP